MMSFISFWCSLSSFSISSNSSAHSSGLIPSAIHSSGTGLPLNVASCFCSFRDSNTFLGGSCFRPFLIDFIDDSSSCFRPFSVDFKDNLVGGFTFASDRSESHLVGLFGLPLVGLTDDIARALLGWYTLVDGAAGVLLLTAFPSVVGTGWNFGKTEAVNIGELLVMAFPSAVVGAGWDLGNFNIAVNVGLKTVPLDMTVSGVTGKRW